jgi:hypothetical protein
MVLLYIDDDAEDVELFLEAVALVYPGVKCAAAKNGSQGLSVLDTLLPDYIFISSCVARYWTRDCASLRSVMSSMIEMS